MFHLPILLSSLFLMIIIYSASRSNQRGETLSHWGRTAQIWSPEIGIVFWWANVKCYRRLALGIGGRVIVMAWSNYMYLYSSDGQERQNKCLGSGLMHIFWSLKKLEHEISKWKDLCAFWLLEQNRKKKHKNLIFIISWYWKFTRIKFF